MLLPKAKSFLIGQVSNFSIFEVLRDVIFTQFALFQMREKNIFWGTTSSKMQLGRRPERWWPKATKAFRRN